MDPLAYIVVGVLVLGGLYLYFKGRRETEGRPKRMATRSKNASKMHGPQNHWRGQFACAEFGELEGARRSL